MMSNTLALTQQLMAIPSLTPIDAGCLDILAERLRKLDFKIELFPCENAMNLWARRGTEGPVFCFAGHTDVVPTGPLDAWTSHPFTPTLRDGFLYGRGAADMKSAVAAFIVAVENFLSKHSNHSGSIALLLTSAEEGPSQLGTPVVIKALEARGEKIEYCIVGEPSADKIVGDGLKNGRRGSLNALITIQGKQGHIAYPHLADNPIHCALAAFDELIKIEWDKGNTYFQPTQCQFSNIQSGTGATNVIPGLLTAQLNFRFSTEVTAEALKAKVESVFKAHRLNYHINWELSGQPFLTSEGTLLQACRDVIEEQLRLIPRVSTDGGTSDGRFIAPTGAEVVELGICNATIHQINECVQVDELEKLTALYEGILKKILLV
jgi:succinyl-diaminopimelate desuccinylase